MVHRRPILSLVGSLPVAVFLSACAPADAASDGNGDTDAEADGGDVPAEAEWDDAGDADVADAGETGDEGCVAIGVEPSCPAVGPVMAPEGRSLLVEQVFETNRWWYEPDAGLGLSCAANGSCILVAWPGPGADVRPGRVCRIAAAADPPTVDCEELGVAPWLAPGERPGFFGGAVAFADRAVIFLDGSTGGCPTDTWHGVCWRDSAPASSSTLSACTPEGTTDVLFSRTIVAAGETVLGYWVPPGNALIGWTTFGACGEEATFGGTIPLDRVLWGCPSLDRGRGGSATGLVALGACLAPPAGRWETDPAETLLLVYLDFDGALVGTPTPISSAPPGHFEWSQGGTRVAVLDDGSAVLAVPALLPEDEDYWGYRGLAHVPAGGSAAAVPLRTAPFKTQVYEPVGLPGARLALLWKEYWAVGSSEWPVCSATCRPLTVLLGLEPSDLDAPAGETICLSMGACVVEARAEYVGGRLVVAWREQTDSTSAEYRTFVHLAVLDLADYAAK